MTASASILSPMVMASELLSLSSLFLALNEPPKLQQRYQITHRDLVRSAGSEGELTDLLRCHQWWRDVLLFS